LKLTQNEKEELENINKRLMDVQLRIAALEMEKHELIETYRNLVGMRSMLWQNICRRLGINPLKQYKVMEDGTVVEVG